MFPCWSGSSKGGASSPGSSLASIGCSACALISTPPIRCRRSARGPVVARRAAGSMPRSHIPSRPPSDVLDGARLHAELGGRVVQFLEQVGAAVEADERGLAVVGRVDLHVRTLLEAVCPGSRVLRLARTLISEAGSVTASS